jgi:hypothetical protein
VRLVNVQPDPISKVLKAVSFEEIRDSHFRPFLHLGEQCVLLVRNS